MQKKHLGLLKKHLFKEPFPASCKEGVNKEEIMKIYILDPLSKTMLSSIVQEKEDDLSSRRFDSYGYYTNLPNGKNLNAKLSALERSNNER